MSRWFHTEAGQEVRELGGYSVLYADCPWKYGVEGGRGAADKHYPTMSLAELCMLPVEHLAAQDAVLFLWGTWPTMLDAYAVMKAWGFEFKNCGFNWVKTNKLQPTPFVGLGRWTRGNSEFCLLGVRGKPKRVDAAVQQIIQDDLVVAPIGEHSEKPPEARNRIMQLMGDTSYVELFGRRRVDGWDVFGNQVDSNVVLLPEGATHADVAEKEVVLRSCPPAADARAA